MKLEKLTVVANLKAGSAQRNRLSGLVDALDHIGTLVTVVETTADPDSANKLAMQAAASGAKLVVPFGGDGTVRQVTEGLLSTDVPMAVYPGGTGNLFASAFYVNPTPKSFATMLKEGQPQPIDLVSMRCTQTNGQPFEGIALVAVGFGPLAESISGCDPNLKRRFGRLVYAVNVVKASYAPNRITARFTHDSGIHLDYVHGAFALNVVPNTVPALSRGCNPSDGLIDTVVLRGSSLTENLACGFCIKTGDPSKSRHYWRCRTKRMTVDTDRPVTVDIDGDPGPTTSHIELSVLPGAVRMLVA